MRDAARIQAAIEILDRVLNHNEAADRALKLWGRDNRFAGSGDRRAIAGHVYAALRSGGSGDGRALMLAALAPMGPQAIMALFDGGPHAPAPLSDHERASLLVERPASGGWLDAALARAFGPRLEQELAALGGRAPLDLRVNTLKATLAAALDRLLDDGIAAEPWPRCRTALRVQAGAVDVTGSAAYSAGLVEVQDAGSQLVLDLAGVSPGMAVLDLCAGAGGKSLALAATMANRGRILACDIAPVRLKRLSPRAQRAGADIIETRLLPQDWQDGPTPFAETFDRVIVDAPCSGSGTWRRNPETRHRLTPQGLAHLTRLQRAILAAAAPLVRPGGRLLYITCSLLLEEGEDVAAAFLADHPEFAAGTSLRLSPARDGTDGFFAAALQKDGPPAA